MALSAALGPATPLAFFSASEPEYHWGRFLAFAERRCPPGQVAVAIAAARAAFADYLAALESAEPASLSM